MKILLVGINSKYTHTSLSVRTLSANAYDCEFAEYTINQKPRDVISGIFKKSPDVICFSCYIWNIDFVKKVASALKKILSNSLIVFGGPEVSFDAEDVLKKNSFVDAVLCGEGELIFKALVDNDFCFKDVNGVTYREGDKIITNPPMELIKDLDALIFPYKEDDLAKNRDKLIYYESSRGCPYRCSYCLSSTEHSVRFKSIEKVKEELLLLIKHRPKTIKFVDRTFNADKKRTEELVGFMIEHGEGVTFHFEIEAHTLSDKFIELMEKSPSGMFRLEIGLQSTNSETIKAIDRNGDFESLSKNVKKLTAMKNVHIHLDLIAGLPKEDIKSFENSFNDAMELNPTVMQLGFLKMLKGTKIRFEDDKYGYEYEEFAPYEMLKNDFLSYDDIILLKDIEECVDKYYNSGAFARSLGFYKNLCGSWWTVFLNISEYFRKNGLFEISISRKMLYDIFAEICKDECFIDLLKFDYLTNNKNSSTPKWSLEGYSMEIHKKRSEIIEKHRGDIFSDYKDKHTAEILKNVHFEIFTYDINSMKKADSTVMIFSKDGKFLGSAPYDEYIKFTIL